MQIQFCIGTPPTELELAPTDNKMESLGLKQHMDFP